jgi:hypothetical protein
MVDPVILSRFYAPLKTYTLENLTVQRVAFTPEDDRQWEVLLEAKAKDTVPFLTDTMRRARDLGIISITETSSETTVDIQKNGVSVGQFGTIDLGNLNYTVVGNIIVLSAPDSGGTVVDDAKRIDTVGNVIYMGYADPGSAETDPVWKIKRVTDQGGEDFKTEWANGNSNRTNRWSERLALTYI